MRSIEPGKYLHFHDLDLEVESLLVVTVEVVSLTAFVKFIMCKSLKWKDFAT